jgi:hypothetical protein
MTRDEGNAVDGRFSAIRLKRKKEEIDGKQSETLHPEHVQSLQIDQETSG